ncbi:MAG: PEP-CTERM sorting domain-containing protein, partial [Planctomycetes bacterium]|nr:PEP-CTERM sorting domain-containing protein [Planctomycetota bacterium]
MNRLKGLSVAFTALVLLSLTTTRANAVPPPGFVDASTFGFATDPYIALQAAINTGRDVYVPNVGTWSLRRPVFMLNDNQEVLFETGVTVEAMTGTFTDNFDSLFEINDRNNVTLRAETAGTVTFSMALTAVTTGQKAGIRLGNSQNVKIQGLTIENPAGDGIVVGDTTLGAFSRDVTIQDVTIDGAYRNGITVTGVDGLLIDNTVIVNTTGAPAGPEVGIDFEPNNTATQPIANVIIRDTIIADNGGVFALGGAGIIWSVPNISGGVQTTGLVENVTAFSNVSHGLTFNAGTLPGWEVRDSLIGENGGATTTGFSSFNGGPDFFVTNTAFWGQTNPVSGDVLLGAGTVTGVTPNFLSTTFGDPNYMVLDLNNNPASILTGASDGGYLGARAPAAALGAATGAIPEPTSAALLGMAAMSLLVVARKRRLTGGMIALAILFVFVGSSTPAHAQLLAYWNFDELDNTADALDPIGERNAVLMGNATRTTGPTGFGRALDLDGTVGTYADVGIQPALSLLGLEYTVAFWAKPTGALPTAGPQRMINMDDGTDFSGGYSFGFLSGNFRLGVSHNNESNNNVTITGATLSSAWEHFAVTYDFADTGSERKIYKNGNLVG